jgi:hypothetical protein
MSTTYTAPTTYPEMAKEDTANIAEPITALKEDGWADNEIPTAKNWNWVSHWAYKWIKYFADALANVIPVESGTFDMTMVGNAAGTITVSYIKFANNNVQLNIPGSSANSTSSLTTLVASGTPVPSSIRPTGDVYTKNAIIPVNLLLGGMTIPSGAYAGALFIDYLGAVYFARLNSAALPDGMGYKADSFPSDNNDNKGWYHITGTYKIA